jgi:hypothetical protein
MNQPTNLTLTGADLPQTDRAKAVLKAGGNPVHLPLRNADLPAPTLISAALKRLSAALAGFLNRPFQNSTPG